MKIKFAMTALAAAAALGLGLQQASAATLVAEGFSYADGELTINDGTGDDVSGGLWIPHSGQTFGDNIDVLGGQAILNNSGSEDAHRIAAGGVDNGGTDVWYYAAKFTVTDDNLADPLVNEDYFLHMMEDSTFNFRARAYIANPTLTAGKFAIGLSATSGGLVVKTEDIDYGVEHLIVVSFDPTTGESRLWLNPSAESDPFISDTNAGAIGTVIDSIAMRQDFISGPVADNEIAVNGLGLATTFDEAVAASMVPEPASLALLGLGGLAMFRRR